MLVNLTRQLGRVTGRPDIWPNILSVRVFLEKSNNFLSRLSEADCPLWCGWASSNQVEARTEHKVGKRIYSPCRLFSSWDTGLHPHLDLDLHPQLSSFSDLQTWTFIITLSVHRYIYTTASVSLQNSPGKNQDWVQPGLGSPLCWQ